MQKRICLSQYEVRRFYLTDRELGCPQFGYPDRPHRDVCHREPPNGICALCNRLFAFRILMEMEK